jgi:hypothetical protein
MRYLQVRAVVMALALAPGCATARIQEQLDADIEDCARVANGDERYYLECEHWARDHAQAAYTEHQRHVDAVYAPAPARTLNCTTTVIGGIAQTHCY